MNEVLIPIFAIVGSFGSLCYLAYVIRETIQSRQQGRLASEFNNKLLDRVSSAQELGALLNSDGGARLMATLSGPQRGTAHERILKSLQAGLVLLALGVGLFVYSFFTPTLDYEAMQALAAFATIGVSLGVGLLLAAGAALTMSRRLGLLHDHQDAGSAGRTPTL